MKLIRLRLTDYRGIVEQEVRFSPDGLTIVEGPNETGKTSLSEAVGHLFKYKDSSAGQAIKKIQPVNRDVGPRIELEAEAGPYQFTYSKRFLKQKETELVVLKPTPENKVGAQAHDRANEILDETMDIALQQALWIEQGGGTHQADLSRQTPLLKALDAAASGTQSGTEEESLFERIHNEFNLYFSDSGREKKPYAQAREDRDAAREQVDDLERRIKETEAETDRVARLTDELADLADREAGLRGDAEKYASEIKEIERLENELEKANLKLDKERRLLEQAIDEQKRRRELIEAVKTATKERAELEVDHAEAARSLELVEELWQGAKEAAKNVEAKRQEVDEHSKLRRADRDYFRGKFDLEELTERKGRIDRVREEAALAADLLEKSGVSEETLAAIEGAERESMMARGRLEQGAPEVHLSALTDIEFTAGGESAALAKGEDWTVSVSDRLIIEVPDKLKVEIKSGSGINELAQSVDAAREKFDAACRDAGVNSLEEARSEHERVREAKRLVADKERVEAENLRDLTFEAIEGKIIALGKSVPAFLSDRAAEPSLPSDLEEAEEMAERAAAAREEAETEWADSRSQADEARQEYDGKREHFTDIKTGFEIKASEQKRSSEALSQAQANESDKKLEEHLTKLELAVQAEDQSVAAATQVLENLNPKTVKTMAETAAASLQTVIEQRLSAETERTRLRARLQLLGEEGMQEQLNGARLRLEHLEREWAAQKGRGAAAKLLYDTMKDERDRAKQAYLAPLKEQIERLGRLVFNHTFSVELAEDLAIASRTIDSVTVPFESLSGGTQEQLGLIARLSCAMLVSEHHGASLIFDDTLGYTDPDRLKSMGAVLATAARDCQVIILTCFPERFSHVGKAEIVRLG